jgi:hypothetical protein
MMLEVSLSWHALTLFLQEPSERGEEIVSNFLSVKSFLIATEHQSIITLEPTPPQAPFEFRCWPSKQAKAPQTTVELVGVMT